VLVHGPEGGRGTLMTEVAQPRVRYWAPEPKPSREQCVAAPVELTSRPDLEITESEDVFRIHETGLDWDLGVRVYQPADPAQIATAPMARSWAASSCSAGRTTGGRRNPWARVMAGKFSGGRSSSGRSLDGCTWKTRPATDLVTRSMPTGPCAPPSDRRTNWSPATSTSSRRTPPSGRGVTRSARRGRAVRQA
jgi:hypothetical protein